MKFWVLYYRPLPRCFLFVTMVGSPVSQSPCNGLWRASKALRGKLSLGDGLTSLTCVKMGKSEVMCVLYCEISISNSRSVPDTQKHSFFSPLRYVLLFRGMPSRCPAFFLFIVLIYPLFCDFAIQGCASSTRTCHQPSHICSLKWTSKCSFNRSLWLDFSV